MASEIASAYFLKLSELMPSLFFIIIYGFLPSAQHSNINFSAFSASSIKTSSAYTSCFPVFSSKSRILLIFISSVISAPIKKSVFCSILFPFNLLTETSLVFSAYSTAFSAEHPEKSINAKNKAIIFMYIPSLHKYNCH